MTSLRTIDYSNPQSGQVFTVFIILFDSRKDELVAFSIGIYGEKFFNYVF